jgi:hypothetical protein
VSKGRRGKKWKLKRIMIDSISHRYGKTQKMIVKGKNGSDALTIALDLAGCMIHFRHRLPTTDEIATLKQYCLTQGDDPSNPS